MATIITMIQKPYPCIESTVEFFYGDKLVRLWFDESEVSVAPRERNAMVNEEVSAFLLENKDAGPAELAKFVHDKYPLCSALQVKDGGGEVEHGMVVYFTDFNG